MKSEAGKGAREMLRLLVLLPFAPRFDSPHGGRATAELLAQVARLHHVGLLCLRASDAPGTAEPLHRICAFVDEVVLHPPHNRALGRLEVLWALLRGRPMQVNDWSSGDFRERLDRAITVWDPDVIHVELRAMAQYLEPNARLRASRILVEHEPVTATARDVFARSRGLERAVRWLDLIAWRRFERRSTCAVDAIVVFTEDDRSALERSSAGRPVVAIPLGVEIPPDPLDPVGTPPPSVVFVGGYGHPPNVDAAVRLVRSILPGVRERIPDALLYLVGDQPEKTLGGLAGDSVVVTGLVPDVRPFLDRAAVVVAPLRIGGGMRNKVLEALAAGKAIVASRLAVAGLDVVDGDQFLLAEEDADFAAAIVRLIEDPSLRRRLGASARAWAEGNLGWESRVLEFDALYRSVAAAAAA